MAIRNNRIVVDLNKVQYVYFCFVNQHGQRRSTIPRTFKTIRNEEIEEFELAHYHPMFPKETCLGRANRLGLIDMWEPNLYLKLQANASLVYTGRKAVSIWEAWKARQFGKKKQ